MSWSAVFKKIKLKFCVMKHDMKQLSTQNMLLLGQEGCPCGYLNEEFLCDFKIYKDHFENVINCNNA